MCGAPRAPFGRPRPWASADAARVITRARAESMDSSELDRVVRDAFARSSTRADGETLTSNATTTLNAIRGDDSCWKLCLDAYVKSRVAETKFWCLQTLAETLRELVARGATMTVEDAETLRRGIGTCVGEASDVGTNSPAFVKNKLAQACALSVALEYPERWPTFFTDVANLLTRGASGVDMFTRVLEALDEEVIATIEAGRSGREDQARSMRVKDAMRADGSIQLVFDAWRQCLQHFTRAEPKVATKVWSVARRYVEWVDVSVVASEDYVRCAKECLMLADGGDVDEDACAAATSYLHAVVTKGMDIATKVQLIANTGLVDVYGALQSLCIARGDDLDEEFVTQVTNLGSAIGTELLSAHRMENVTALGPELPARVSAMLHQVTPLVLSSIGFRHERAVLVALPFLYAYVSHVKSQPALLSTAQPALEVACQALIARGSFPVENTDGLDWDDGASALTQEFEGEVLSLRTELNVQFKNIARLAPQLAREVVRQVLTNAIVAGDLNSRRWENIEVAVSALYTLGEGADDPAVKPMSTEERSKATNGTGEVTETPLGALAVSLIRCWDANAGKAAHHRLVAPIFLETCVRYHAILEHDDASLLVALTAFLDARGIAHRDRAVRSRACYLLARLSRPLRCKLSDRVEDIMRAIHPHLIDIARSLPEQNAVNTTVVSVSASGIQSRAMAESGNDDTLYLFEAVGVLLGADEVDEQEQYRHLSQIASALCHQIEEVVDGRSGADDLTRVALATRAIIAFGNVSKGFAQRTCLTARPQTGEVFRSCLATSLRCLDIWPRNASVRSRVTGLLHRMIELLGTTVTQYLASTVDRLRRDADALELRETLVLFNQLLATYKAELAPFVVQVLPNVADQVFRTITTALAQASEQAMGGNVAKNTETIRESEELERTWLTTAAALGANGLLTPTFTGHPNAEITSALREQLITHLLRTASSHGSVSARKVALQALKSFIEEWLGDDRPNEPTGAPEGASKTFTIKYGPRDDLLPGFASFVFDRVCVECCVVPALRGDLDLADAASVAVLNESFAILAIARVRKPQALSSTLHRAFADVLADQANAVAGEYLAAVDAYAGGKPHTRSSKSLRALVAATTEAIRRRGRVLGSPHIARRGS